MFAYIAVLCVYVQYMKKCLFKRMNVRRISVMFLYLAPKANFEIQNFVPVTAFMHSISSNLTTQKF